MELDIRKAEPTVQAWQSDKKSPEKSGFDFFGDFVLTEGLGGGAGHGKSGISRLAPTGRKEIALMVLCMGKHFPRM